VSPHTLRTGVLALAVVLASSVASADEPDAAPGDPHTAPGADGSAARGATENGNGTGSDAGAEDDALTTEVWREPRVPIDLQWNLLALPERAVELAFLPLGVLVTAVERYRLDKRVYDLLRNASGTIVLTPNAKLSLGDGFGVGASLRVKWREANERRVRISGLYRLNGDYEVGVDLKRKLIRANGRRIEANVTHEVDRNLPFYGIGHTTSVADERALRSEYVDGEVSYELNERGELDLTGTVFLGYRKERLSPGDDPGLDPVGIAGDSVAPPPGFHRWSDFASATAEVSYDTRDTTGRPSKGFVAILRGAVAEEVDGQSLSAGVGSLTATTLLPLLPDHRVLALSAGLRIAGPLSSGDEVPLHLLTTLGRTQHLRGYNRARFRDRHGWWASAEYGFPIYEYANTGVALDASFFFDAGRVARDLDTIFDGKIRYSTGIGLRAAHDVLSIFRLDLGWSPEGIEFGFSLGKFD